MQTMQTFSALILAGIFGVVALMMFLALMALFYRAAIGSQQDWAVTRRRDLKPCVACPG